MKRKRKYKGLTITDVQDRIAKGFVNISSKQKSKKVTEIIIENVFSVFNLIILSIMAFMLIFYFKTFDNRLLLDSLGIFSIAVINTLIAIIQEIKAKNALDKVSLLLKNEVTVIRDDEEVNIDRDNIVKDDIIVVERGDQIIVDGKVLESNNLEIDESLLTGESIPVIKNEEDVVYSGSFCLSGSGLYIAEKVGDESYASEITKMAKQYKFTLSPLQYRLNFIVKLLFTIAIVLVILTILIEGADFSNVDFIRKISTIMSSLVPQGLVLMASVSFALGVYRISKIGAIIQKLNAIESFSNVKIVCTDKTGTLTQNKLAVKAVTVTESISKEEAEKLLGTYAEFSTDKNATLNTLSIYKPADNVNVISEIPFSSENKFSTLELEINGKKEHYIFGALDILTEHSNNKAELDKIYETNKLHVYRNLLFGRFNNEQNNKDGLIGKFIDALCITSITDEVRRDVMDAISLFEKNDIEVKILSGDSPAAVQAITREIGWDIKDNELITGTELDKINDSSLTSTIKSKKIFARLKPEHKLRIIKDLKKNKIYTAMIGDGVNDLPAIKEADMGIAMEEGSKITKEVADIVLLKNKFSLLPSIFNEGNRIVNTVSDIAKLFLTKNFMVIYLSLLSLFFLFEFPLTPRRVALINLFSIGLPSLIIALKNCNTDKLKFFTRDLISYISISAFVIVAAGYTSQFISSSFPGITQNEIQMIMMAVMIMTTTANFLTVTLQNDILNRNIYIIYAAALVGLFLFLMLIKVDFVILNWIKLFYEIINIKTEYLSVIFIISGISAVVLFLLQLWRKKIITRLNAAI